MTNKNAVTYVQFASPNASPKSNRIHFSDASIKHLKPPKKRDIFWCDKSSGFGIRVTPKGNKTWICSYRHEGKSYMLTFGKYPKMPLHEARQLYFEAHAKLEMGHNPSDDKVKVVDALTVKDLVSTYIDYCKRVGKKNWRRELQCFKRDLLPVVGHKKVHIVNHNDIMKVINPIIDRGSLGQAVHVFGYIRMLFNFAADMKINKMRRRDNPCLDIKLNIKRKNRTRHLTPREIYLFWHNLEKAKADRVTILAMRFMLCTVTRGIEVRQFKKQFFDLNENIWTLPETKNSKPHRIHLCSLGLEIINELNKANDHSEYMFASPQLVKVNGEKQSRPLTLGCLGKVIRRSFDLFEIEEYFTPHDLRRTSATLIAALFGDMAYAKRALNHVERSATAVYDQYIYDREKKVAMNTLNFALERIITSKNVESVPSLAMLRDEAYCKGLLNPKPIEVADKQRGFQTTLLNPVSYSLSASLNV